MNSAKLNKYITEIKLAHKKYNTITTALKEANKIRNKLIDNSKEAFSELEDRRSDLYHFVETEEESENGKSET